MKSPASLKSLLLLALLGAAWPQASRAQAPGNADPTFSETLNTEGSVSQVAVQPDGKILVLGRTQSPSHDSFSRLAADGASDASFSTTGVSIPGSPVAFALQPDGKIVYVGTSGGSGVTQTSVGRLKADGTQDANFQPGSFSSVSNIGSFYAVALAADGKIVVGGDFNNYNGLTRPGVARLNADGTVDDAFVPPTSGIVVSRALAVAVQPDSKVLVAGKLTMGSQSLAGIVRLLPDGSVDPDFVPQTVDNLSSLDKVTIVLQPDGKILFAGGFNAIGANSRSYLVRLLATGSLDTAFNPFVDAPVATIALQGDGKIFLGGGFVNVSSATRRGVARLKADGQLDLTFDPGTGPGGTDLPNIRTIALQPTGKVIVGGAFAGFGGTVQRDNLARLLNDYTGAAQPTDWDAGRDFAANENNNAANRAQNPNALVPQWSYGYRDAIEGSGLTLFTPDNHSDTFADRPAEHGFGTNTNNVSVNTGTEPVVFSFCCGDLAPIFPRDMTMDANNPAHVTVVRWTAPAAGTYTYQAAWDDLDPNGGNGAGGSVVINGQKVFGQSWNNGLGNGASTTGAVALQAGGAIDFVLDDKGDGNFDTTRFNATIVPGGTLPPDGSIAVPGTSNLWLAGALPGTTASAGQDTLANAAPFQVPNLILTPGQTLTFSATGNVSNDPANPVTVGPDGGPYLGFAIYKHEKENGIADLTAPINSLIGVFLDDSIPDPLTVPDGYDLSQPPGTDYTLIGPALRKPFFIGDGKTADGTGQKIRVPAGATRLYLGSLDPSDQKNNVGSFFVKVEGGGTNPPASGPALIVNPDDFSYTVKNQPSTGTVVPGDVVTYSLTVRNTGTAPAANVVVKASFDVNNAKFKSASDGGTAAANVVTWTLPTLNNGDHQTLTYSVKVKGNVDAASGLRLGASVLSATADAPAVALSTANLPGVGLTIVPLFNISTQSDGVTAVGGGPLTFTFTVVNRGTTLVSDITVDVRLPDSYVPSNFQTATFINEKGKPVGAPYKLGASLDNGQFDPAAVRLYINGLSAGESKRFTVTVNIPYDATPGSAISLPPVQLNGHIGDGKVTYNQPPYGTKISNDPPLAPPRVTLVKLSPTASEIDGLRLAAFTDSKKLLGKSAKQLLQAIADASDKTLDQINALTSDQIVALINPYVTQDSDEDSNGKLLLDVPAPNAKQPAPYITYVLFYLNTSDTGTAAGITISDAVAPGLKLDPNSVYVKGKKVDASTVSDGSGNLTFTDKNIKPNSGGLITYHALVPAPGTSTLNPGDIIQPVKASLTTASLSSQSFGTSYEDGILVTGPANAICESSQVSSNQVTADGNIIYNIFYKNTGGMKSKDFLVVSPVPPGAVYHSIYTPTGTTQSLPSASFLTVGQQVRPSDQTRGEGIVEPVGADTAAGATSGLVVFHLGKVKPRGLGFVQVVYQFSPAVLAGTAETAIKHQPYVDAGSFPTTKGIVRGPTPRGLREGPHTRSFLGALAGLFKAAAPNVTHLHTPPKATLTVVSQAAPQPPALSIVQAGPLSVVEGGKHQYTFAITNTSDTPIYQESFLFLGPVDTIVDSTSASGATFNGLRMDAFLPFLAPHGTNTVTVTVRNTSQAKKALLFLNATVLGLNQSGVPVATAGISGMTTTVITADQARDANKLSVVQTDIARNAVAGQGLSVTTLASAPNFAARAARITPDSLQVAVAGADVISLDQGTAALVAAGAGNLVAAGAGNLISQDGAGLVAAGAGNLVAAGAGNLITLSGVAGLGTIKGDALLLPSNLNALVAAGAGNLVAAGAGNVVSNDGGSLVSNVTGLASGTLASLQTNVVMAGLGNNATLISNDGNGLVGNAGGTLISNDGNGLVGNAGGALIGNAGGTLIGNAGGTLTGRDHPAPGQPHTRAIVANGGIKFGSPDNTKYAHFNSTGGFVFSMNPDPKNQ